MQSFVINITNVGNENVFEIVIDILKLRDENPLMSRYSLQCLFEAKRQNSGTTHRGHATRDL